jgi:hypothetical protein
VSDRAFFCFILCAWGTLQVAARIPGDLGDPDG